MDIPKGKLIPVGGNEDKGMNENADPEFFLKAGILKRILSEIKGPESKIEIITTATSIPKVVSENYRKAFTRLGAGNVDIMNLRKRNHATDPAFLKRIKEADGILFTGGDQLAITMTIGGTEFMKILRERYFNEDFTIAGTSAGAMAMSTTMIYQGNSVHALNKNEVKLSPGLALIKNAIIDTHFMNRGRFGRLAQAVARNPSIIGIGLGEDTGAVITGGSQVEIIGSGHVILVDGHKISYSNILEVEEGNPLCIENLIVHIMVKGNCYDMKERKFCSSNKDLKSEENPATGEIAKIS